jgi:hypothetical protein
MLFDSISAHPLQAQLAVSIEQAMWVKFQNANKEYTSKARDLIFNIKVSHLHPLTIRG